MMGRVNGVIIWKNRRTLGIDQPYTFLCFQGLNIPKIIVATHSNIGKEDNAYITA